jgi:hypothetical protein
LKFGIHRILKYIFKEEKNFFPFREISEIKLKSFFIFSGRFVKGEVEKKVKIETKST